MAKDKVFPIAKTLAELRKGEGKFGPVWAETNLDVIFSKLLKAESTEERAALENEFHEEIDAHPILRNFPEFDGIPQDILNLYITDPERARELYNELQLQLKKALQHALQRTSTPRLTRQ